MDNSPQHHQLPTLSEDKIFSTAGPVPNAKFAVPVEFEIEHKPDRSFIVDQNLYSFIDQPKPNCDDPTSNLEEFDISHLGPIQKGDYIDVGLNHTQKHQGELLKFERPPEHVSNSSEFQRICLPPDKESKANHQSHESHLSHHNRFKEYSSLLDFNNDSSRVFVQRNSSITTDKLLSQQESPDHASAPDGEAPRMTKLKMKGKVSISKMSPSKGKQRSDIRIIQGLKSNSPVRVQIKAREARMSLSKETSNVPSNKTTQRKSMERALHIQRSVERLSKDQESLIQNQSNEHIEAAADSKLTHLLSNRMIITSANSSQISSYQAQGGIKSRFQHSNKSNHSHNKQLKELKGVKIELKTNSQINPVPRPQGTGGGQSTHNSLSNQNTGRDLYHLTGPKLGQCKTSQPVVSEESSPINKYKVAEPMKVHVQSNPVGLEEQTPKLEVHLSKLAHIGSDLAEKPSEEREERVSPASLAKYNAIPSLKIQKAKIESRKTSNPKLVPVAKAAQLQALKASSFARGGQGSLISKEIVIQNSVETANPQPSISKKKSDSNHDLVIINLQRENNPSFASTLKRNSVMAVKTQQNQKYFTGSNNTSDISNLPPQIGAGTNSHSHHHSTNLKYDFILGEDALIRPEKSAHNKSYIIEERAGAAILSSHIGGEEYNRSQNESLYKVKILEKKSTEMATAGGEATVNDDLVQISFQNQKYATQGEPPNTDSLMQGSCEQTNTSTQKMAQSAIDFQGLPSDLKQTTLMNQQTMLNKLLQVEREVARKSNFPGDDLVFQNDDSRRVFKVYEILKLINSSKKYDQQIATGEIELGKVLGLESKRRSSRIIIKNAMGNHKVLSLSQDFNGKESQLNSFREKIMEKHEKQKGLVIAGESVDIIKDSHPALFSSTGTNFSPEKLDPLEQVARDQMSMTGHFPSQFKNSARGKAAAAPLAISSRKRSQFYGDRVVKKGSTMRSSLEVPSKSGSDHLTTPKFNILSTEEETHRANLLLAFIENQVSIHSKIGNLQRLINETTMPSMYEQLPPPTKHSDIDEKGESISTARVTMSDKYAQLIKPNVEAFQTNQDLQPILKYILPYLGDKPGSGGGGDDQAYSSLMSKHPQQRVTNQTNFTLYKTPDLMDTKQEDSYATKVIQISTKNNYADKLNKSSFDRGDAQDSSKGMLKTKSPINSEINLPQLDSSKDLNNNELLNDLSYYHATESKPPTYKQITPGKGESASQMVTTHVDRTPNADLKQIRLINEFSEPAAKFESQKHLEESQQNSSIIVSNSNQILKPMKMSARVSRVSESQEQQPDASSFKDYDPIQTGGTCRSSQAAKNLMAVTSDNTSKNPSMFKNLGMLPSNFNILSGFGYVSGGEPSRVNINEIMELSRNIQRSQFKDQTAMPLSTGFNKFKPDQNPQSQQIGKRPKQNQLKILQIQNAVPSDDFGPLSGVPGVPPQHQHQLHFQPGMNMQNYIQQQHYNQSNDFSPFLPSTLGQSPQAGAKRSYYGKVNSDTFEAQSFPSKPVSPATGTGSAFAKKALLSNLHIQRAERGSIQETTRTSGQNSYCPGPRNPASSGELSSKQPIQISIVKSRLVNAGAQYDYTSSISFNDQSQQHLVSNSSHLQRKSALEAGLGSVDNAFSRQQRLESNHMFTFDANRDPRRKNIGVSNSIAIAGGSLGKDSIFTNENLPLDYQTTQNSVLLQQQSCLQQSNATASPKKKAPRISNSNAKYFKKYTRTSRFTRLGLEDIGPASQFNEKMVGQSAVPSSVALPNLDLGAQFSQNTQVEASGKDGTASLRKSQEHFEIAEDISAPKYYLNEEEKKKQVLKFLEIENSKQLLEGIPNRVISGDSQLSKLRSQVLFSREVKDSSKRKNFAYFRSKVQQELKQKKKSIVTKCESMRRQSSISGDGYYCTSNERVNTEEGRARGPVCDIQSKFGKTDCGPGFFKKSRGQKSKPKDLAMMNFTGSLSQSHKGLIHKISNQLKNALNPVNKHGLDFTNAKRKSAANYLPVETTGQTRPFEMTGATMRNNEFINSVNVANSTSKTNSLYQSFNHNHTSSLLKNNLKVHEFGSPNNVQSGWGFSPSAAADQQREQDEIQQLHQQVQADLLLKLQSKNSRVMARKVEGSPHQISTDPLEQSTQYVKSHQSGNVLSQLGQRKSIGKSPTQISSVSNNMSATRVKELSATGLNVKFVQGRNFPNNSKGSAGGDLDPVINIMPSNTSKMEQDFGIHKPQQEESTSNKVETEPSYLEPENPPQSKFHQIVMESGLGENSLQQQSMESGVSQKSINLAQWGNDLKKMKNGTQLLSKRKSGEVVVKQKFLSSQNSAGRDNKIQIIEPTKGLAGDASRNSQPKRINQLSTQPLDDQLSYGISSNIHTSRSRRGPMVRLKKSHEQMPSITASKKSGSKGHLSSSVAQRTRKDLVAMKNAISSITSKMSVV